MEVRNITVSSTSIKLLRKHEHKLLLMAQGCARDYCVCEIHVGFFYYAIQGNYDFFNFVDETLVNA